ncbi:MAG: glycosyltransferase family 4 protein, partial [Patescibacteria group bacterium]|nr:glycosyltransferase family 4 protein [Patescibacteria group bacterium]
MPLLLAASLYPPQARGPATFAGQLVDYLTTRGERVVVVRYSEVERLPPVVRHLVYFFKLYRASAGCRAVLALDPVSVGLPALWLSRVRHMPLVLRLGGDYAWEQGVTRFGINSTLDEFVRTPVEDLPYAVGVLARIERYVAAGASTIVVPSSYLKGVVGHWGVPAKKIDVIASAAAVARASLNKAETRQRVSWHDEPVVFSAGALVPWKGFAGLIDAVAMVRRAHPNVRLIIAGDGPERRALLERAATEGFDPTIVFTGTLPHTILVELLQAADVFALNSSYEGLSHQLIEAMQAGVPIVTTGAGGNPDLIQDGVTGRVVPVGDTQ